jgi:hypothetical protein
MNIEDVIRAWKADESDQDTHAAINPIGEELTDQELLEATGGACLGANTCDLFNLSNVCGVTVVHCIASRL